MIGLGTLLYIYQGISSIYNACASIVGLWFPASIVAYKLDINGLFVIICLLIMFVFLLLVLMHIYRTSVNSFTEILTRILNENTSIRITILGAFSLLMLLVKSSMIMLVLLYLIKYLAFFIFSVAGHILGIRQNNR
jgi:hypothetical protein